MKRSLYSDKDIHLTCNLLLHYLVKVEDIKTIPTWTAYAIDCCRIPAFITFYCLLGLYAD